MDSIMFSTLSARSKSHQLAQGSPKKNARANQFNTYCIQVPYEIVQSVLHESSSEADALPWDGGPVKWTPTLEEGSEPIEIFSMSAPEELGDGIHKRVNSSNYPNLIGHQGKLLDYLDSKVEEGNNLLSDIWNNREQVICEQCVEPDIDTQEQLTDFFHRELNSLLKQEEIGIEDIKLWFNAPVPVVCGILSELGLNERLWFTRAVNPAAILSNILERIGLYES